MRTGGHASPRRPCRLLHNQRDGLAFCECSAGRGDRQREGLCALNRGAVARYAAAHRSRGSRQQPEQPQHSAHQLLAQAALDPEQQPPQRNPASAWAAVDLRHRRSRF